MSLPRRSSTPETRSRNAMLPRGYAMPIVFLVLLLLGISIATLADAIHSAAESTHKQLQARRNFYGCDGIIRLASGVTSSMQLDSPDADYIDMTLALDPIVKLAETNGINIKAGTSAAEEVTVIDSGPLTGMEVLSSTSSLGVASDPSVGCSWNISQPIGKMSPLQFVALSIDTGSFDYGMNVRLPDPAFTWGRSTIDARKYSWDINESSQWDTPLRLPAPPSGADVGAERARTFLPYIQPPVDPSAERASGRIAYQASLRIIDGAWFTNDKTGSAWPGTALYADKPCGSEPCNEDRTDFKRTMYSMYESTIGGLNSGIVSYGARKGGDPAFPSTSGTPPTTTMKPAGNKTDLLAAAHATFTDPVAGKEMLPINIDLGRLGATLLTTPTADKKDHELYNAICMDARVCAVPFNGVLYITSVDGKDPNASGVDKSEAFAMCAGGCASKMRYNAVRLVNASDLSFFAATGLTVATDLPLYIEGDFNRDGKVRALLLADRVTVLSDKYNDNASSSDGRVTIGASMIAGWSLSRRFSDLVRTIEPGVQVRVRGALIGGFSSTSALNDGLGYGSFDWDYPAELLSPKSEQQPPGVPRIALGLPPEIVPVDPFIGGLFYGCGGGY